MSIVEPKPSGFTIVEKGKDPLFEGMIITLMPIEPTGSFAPPDATDVKVIKDTKNPDGGLEQEGSYKTSVQIFHIARNVHPLGKEWLYCEFKSATPEPRDERAKLCRELAPAPL
jgi:hypothetical protein